MAYKIIKITDEINDTLSYFADAYQIPKTQQVMKALESGHHWFSSKQTKTPDNEHGHHGRTHFLRTCERLYGVKRSNVNKSVAIPSQAGNILRTLQSMVWHETDVRYNQQVILEACLHIWQSTQSKLLLTQDTTKDETDNEEIINHSGYRATAKELDALLMGMFELGMRYQYHLFHCQKNNMTPHTPYSPDAPWPLTMWPQGIPFPNPAVDTTQPFYWSDGPAWVGEIIEHQGTSIANRGLYGLNDADGPKEPKQVKPTVMSFL